VIVIDIGCQPQDHEESIVKLCEAYKPTILYGFDPHPDLQPGLDTFVHPKQRMPGRTGHPSMKVTPPPTTIVRSRMAAWIHNGIVLYREAGICSSVVGADPEAITVPCFDLAAWMMTLPLADVEVVLKIDAEGAEYPLLWAIHNNGLDLLIDEALIEYHPSQTANGWESDRPPLRCPVQDWDLHW